MFIGPFANGGAVLIGGILGASLGKYLPVRVKSSLPLIFGLASMGLGLAMVPKVHYMPAVVLSVIIGTVIGELIFLEKGIGIAAGGARTFAAKLTSANSTLSPEEFQEKFVSIIVLFCASGTGVFGSMNEGMTGDPSILFIKTVLDFFTAAIFATQLGFAVALVVIPQFIIQMILASCAHQIVPLTTPIMIADFSATGGLLMLATGFRICGIKVFPVANMLPALFLAMPLSHLWGCYFH